MNLFLHGVEDFQIVRGDTLRSPAFFDRRPASPRSTASSPIRRSRSKKWGEDVWASRPVGPQLRRRAARRSTATTPGCST